MRRRCGGVFAKGKWWYDIKWMDQHKGCGSGKQNVPEDELSLATKDDADSEHHAAARNSLEDADTVHTKYAKNVESLVLADTRTIDGILGMNSGVGFIFLPVCRVLKSCLKFYMNILL